jgi:hypothetical protein
MVMPQFFFCAGFACRLTLLRRSKAAGPRAAYLHMLRRCVGLLLVGFVLYSVDGGARTWAELVSLGPGGFLATAFQRNYFQTIVHIAITTLWVLPVVTAGPWVRIGYAVVSAALHFALSYLGYYDWVMARPGIDGGPLGFLTWTIPFLIGTLVFDLTLAHPPRWLASRLIVAGAILMVLGYALSCLNRVTPPNDAVAELGWTGVLVEPPPLPPRLPANIWTMSQRAGSLTYQVYAAGFALVVYTGFVLLCDVGGFRSYLLQILGQNALAAYIIHGMVAAAVKPYAPKDAPMWFALAAFAVFVGISIGFVRYLDRHKLYLRL